MEIKDLLASSNYIIINKTLIEKLGGLLETVVLSDLIGMESYYRELGALEENGSFYYTESDMTKYTTLSGYLQRQAINNLMLKGLVEVEVSGLPAKRKFKLNTSAINSLMVEPKIKKEEVKVTKGKDKRGFGEFSNVYLTEEELEKLQTRFPKDYLEKIEELSCYIENKKKDPYVSHYATLLNWLRNDKAKEPIGKRNSEENRYQIEETKEEKDKYLESLRKKMDSGQYF